MSEKPKVNSTDIKWYQYIAENIREAFWVVSPDWNKVYYISPAYEDLWGLTCDSLYQNPLSWLDSVIAEDRQKLSDFIGEKSAEKFSEAVFPEYRITRPDGSVRWIFARAFPMCDKHGEISYLTGIAEDITERKEAELALKASESRFKNLVNVIPHGIQVTDEKGIITFSNRAHHNILGYKNGELIGKSILDFLPNEREKENLKGYLEHLVEEGPTPSPLVSINKTKDERLITVQVNWDYVKDNEDKIIGFTSIITDISAEKQKERELLESDEKYQSLIEATSDWVWEVNQEGVYTYVSPRIKDLLGYEPEEVINKTPFDLMSPEEAKRVREIFETLVAQQGSIDSLENTNLHKDGHPVVLETSGRPFFDAKGELKGYRGIDRDITARKQSENKLVEQARALQETNVALRVVLRESEVSKSELEKDMLSNIKDLLLPYVAELGSRLSDEDQLFFLDIIKANINEITSSFSRSLKIELHDLTPREIQVADFIRQGRTNKEIAKLLNITPSAVDFHRRNLRKKFNIKGTKANLRSHLLSIVG
jgi:PAS domain S-box-containing protein